MKKFEMVNESYSLVYEIKDFRRFSVRRVCNWKPGDWYSGCN